MNPWASPIVPFPPQRPFDLRGQLQQQAVVGLAGLGVSSVLLEGGPTLLGAFLTAGLVDEVRAFIAPKLLGAGLSPLNAPARPMHAAQPLQDVTARTLGPDVLITGLLHDIPRL